MSQKVAAVGYKSSSSKSNGVGGVGTALKNSDALIDQTLLTTSSAMSSSTKDKSSSLPGYFANRGFHDVYSSHASSSAYQGHHPAHPPAVQQHHVKDGQWSDNKNKTSATSPVDHPSSAPPSHQSKKKKWPGWSGIFRRNKSATAANQPASSAQPVAGNSSDEEAAVGHLAKGHQALHQHVSSARPPEEDDNNATTSVAGSQHHLHHQQQKRFLHPPRNVSKDRSPLVDSLSPLQSDWSSSQTSLSRKERRDAILARAQARRNGSAGGSSSEDDGVSAGGGGDGHLLSPSPSRMRDRRRHHSQESLTSNGSSSRAGHPKSRTGRTERYLQRRSRDEESLRREQQQQLGSPSRVDHHYSPDWSSSAQQLNTSRRWVATATAASMPPGSRVAIHHPEMTNQQRLGDSPVTFRKPNSSSSYGSQNSMNNHFNNNNNSPAVMARAQSVLVTHGKLSTPPPPPPRNPLKKSYLLQVQQGVADAERHFQQPARPTSYSFVELSRYGQHHQQQRPPVEQLHPTSSSHDYQNVDQNGRLVTPADRSAMHLPLTSPIQRRVLGHNSSQQQAQHRQQQPGMAGSRHHSAIFPTAQSPSYLKTPEQERIKPPWLSSATSSANTKSTPPPVREFWRSKEAHQTPVSTKSARERLAVGNGSLSSLNSGELSSPLSRDAVTASSGDVPAVAAVPTAQSPLYASHTSGNALPTANRPAIKSPLLSTPKRNPPVLYNNNNNNHDGHGGTPHHVRELSQLKPSTDRHLEQAICELEQIYRSLKLDGDEDLLDRAERRDLPTVHQQLAQQNHPLVYHPLSGCSGSESGGDPLGGHGITSDLDTMMNWSISGSFENVANNNQERRPRTPSSRRSAVPDKVADDMAVRRLAAAARKSQANDPQSIAAQSGSYLLLSPAVTAATEDHQQHQDGSSRSSGSLPDEPDIVYDDVAYRHIRQVNQSLRVVEPQPPFGIPLGPVTPASPSDYLHTCVTPEKMELRPLLHPTKYPDLVRDDLAFRNLRKDAGHAQLGPVNTEKLDDLLKEEPSHHSSKTLRKKRAVRSLSANIAQLIRKDAARPSGGGGVVDFNRARDEEEEEDERYLSLNPFDSRAQSLSDLLDETASPVYTTNNNFYGSKLAAKTPRAVKQRSELKRIGKETDEPDNVVIQRQVRPTASWVERAHLSDVPTSVTALHSSSETICSQDGPRVPALAKLFPSSALLPAKKSEQGSSKDLDMDHLITELSSSSNTSSGGRNQVEVADSSGGRLAAQKNKPPTGICSPAEVVETSSHYWEESPLFQSQPQFNFPPSTAQTTTTMTTRRSVSPANSSDSGQVSCCAREVRQILHHQIRQEEMERERLASSGRKTSRTTDPAVEKPTSDKSAAPKGRPASTAVSTPTTLRDNPVVRKSSGRRMSNNNDNSAASAASAAVDKRDERIARYKEERRKQLQARHQIVSGMVERSSSSEDLPHEEQSYAKYKHRKQMQKQQLESRPVEDPSPVQSSDVANSNVGSSVSGGGIKRFIKRDSPLSEENNGGVAPVRINRAARLRAAATSGTPPPPTPDEKSGVTRTKRLSVPAMEQPIHLASDGQMDEQSGVSLRSKAALSSPSSSSALLQNIREKDKSTKRKSNLNRALTDEQILTAGQMDSQDDAGKRIRRRKTGELAVSASSAETDLSSSVDNTIQRPSPQPGVDLRAHLRKTNQPPAFIRPTTDVSPSPALSLKEKSPSPGPPPSSSSSSSVPWRTGKVAVKAAESSTPMKAEDLTARIEALTAIATQTVAKVDRLTATPTATTTEPVNGSVKAVATKLLNQVSQPKAPVSPTSVGRRPVKMDSPVAGLVMANSVSSSTTTSTTSPFVKSAQQPATTTTPVSKNRAVADPMDKTPARANNTLASKVFGRNVDTATTQSQPTSAVAANKATVDNNPSAGPSAVKTVQGILKKKVEETTGESSSTYPILRVDEEPVTIPSDPVSILKKRFEEQESPAVAVPTADGSPDTHHSILKRSLSRDGSAESGRSQSPVVVVDPLNSILKRPPPAASPSSNLHPNGDPTSVDPRPILKKKSLTDEPSHQPADSPRPILKKRSSTEDENEPAGYKPILKSGRRTSSEQPEGSLENHLARLRRTEQSRESAPHRPPTPPPPPVIGITAQESDVSGQPEGERPLEERQLSVAERISCMESQAQPAVVAPWRLPRPPTVSPSNSVDPPELPERRRKSLDANHAVDSNRMSGLVDAVNRHVVPAPARSPAEPDPAIKPPPTEEEEEEFDPSKLSLKERMKLFERPPVHPNTAQVIAAAAPRPRHRKAIAARFLTQPITIREMEKARSRDPPKAEPSSGPSTRKPLSPALEGTKQETVTVDQDQTTLPEDQTTEASGLERIRGILRRKSSDTPMETKGILRSKSPSVASSADHPPKSILKRHSPDVDERLSSDVATCPTVSTENPATAQLPDLESEARNSQPASSPLEDPPSIEDSATNTATVEVIDTSESIEIKKVEVEEEACGRVTDQRDPSPLAHHSARRETTETIIVESEGNSSGTETTTTVTFRLGGAGAGSSTSIKQSQIKIKNHKVNVMEELGETSLASRPAIETTRWAADESDDDSSSSAEVKTTVSLRLAALQKSGDTDWRKRISKPGNGSVTTSPATEMDEAANNSDGDIPTKSSIADRLKVLESAQKTWRNRVHEPDAARFTVAGKMGQRPASVHGAVTTAEGSISPLLERKKKTPKALPFRVKTSDGSAASDSSPGTPSTDDVKPPFNRSTSDPNGIPSKLAAAPNLKIGSSKVTSRIVSVPRPDDETFTSFFTASSWSLATSQSVSTVVSSSSFSEMTAEDFDQIVISRDLVVEKRAVHVQRRKNITSRNPIKSLILRSDMLRDEYEEVDTGVAEREVQRIKLEQLAKNSHLAVEALAGLASKEDFSSIALKSAANKEDHSGRSMYLMQIKGRRQIQTRLIEPLYTSVNSGDCFILVTPTDVIQFVGRYSNVIERARSSEVAQRILLKKDLGCHRATQVQLIEEDKVGCDSFVGPSKRFWNALGRTGSQQPVHPAGPPEEDELYESAITSTNTVWQLDGDHLEPCEQHWGTILQTDILDPNKVMVFDFGSEMFVWSGKMAPLESRKKAMQLAKELWDQGYDYTECVINPVFQRPTGPEESRGSRRPEWTLLKAAKQHMEPVLFREKFFDWPDKSGLIKIKTQETDDNKPVTHTADISSLEPYDAQLMLDNQVDDPDLELEGSHLGRGVEYYDQAERRLQQISTLNFKVWHLLDYEKVLLDDVSRGQFHCRDTYIIRWQYRITVTGKDLKGQPSVHGLLGRDRFCYFIWHGAQAPSTDQGASALKTVELDEERGPHVRVQQGHEPPAFLAIFQGRMAVHSGKRGESSGETGWRLYIVRGEKEEEAHLLQVERCVQALRSRGCLLLINQSSGTIFVWHGAKSLKHTRQVAASAAAALKQHRPPELNVRSEASLTIKEQFEGAESREFWEGLGHNSRVADRSLYLSLAEQPKENRYDYTPRLFHLTSWTGQFRADEVAPTCRFPSLPCPYPFVQEDLYSANQPTLFLLDNEHDVWLWQGWWPDLPDTENTNTGSGKLRLAVERRCAMESVIEYCRLKADQRDGSPPPAYLVSAGLEPMAFTALFPYWTVDEHVGQLNIQDGKSPGEMQSIQDVLDRLKRTTYSLNELQVRPPPEGVDPTRLESYLNDDDFQETMNMTKLDFYALPAWRQSQLRKETGLF